MVKKKRGGSGRPRTPDTPIPISSITEQTPSITTTSPTTDRVIKKSKVDGNGRSLDAQPTQANPPPARSIQHSNQTLHSSTTPTHPVRPHFPAAALSAAGQFQQLTVFLDTALAAARELVTAHADSLANLDLQNVVNTANAISATLSQQTFVFATPLASKTPQPSYAHIAKVAQPLHPATSSHPPPAQHSRTHPQLPTPNPRRHPLAAQRIIVGYEGTGLFYSNTRAFQPDKFCELLTEKMHAHGHVVQACGQSTHGRLILFLKQPSTAKQVLSVYREVIQRSYAEFFHLQDWRKITLELDTPWHPVVVSSLPLGDTVAATSVYVQTLVASNPWLSGAVPNAGARFLHRVDDLMDNSCATLKFYVRDASLCKRIVREGLFFEGVHHRASIYRPRPRRRRPMK